MQEVEEQVVGEGDYYCCLFCLLVLFCLALLIRLLRCSLLKGRVDVGIWALVLLVIWDGMVDRMRRGEERMKVKNIPYLYCKK